MIQPPGWDGAAFSDRWDGDLRQDPGARQAISDDLRISTEWATVQQVHGDAVVRVAGPGKAGEADALWTTEPGLPLAVFTADCFGVVLISPRAVGVAHAGWRGAASGVVANTRAEMTRAGHSPERAAVGPGIGSCCFEVGPDVARRFPSHSSETTWGTPSVDLPSVILDQLEGLQTWAGEACTLHGDSWFSHRSDRTRERMASIGWVR